MGALDAELVQEATDGGGQVAERVVLVDVLRRASVPRHVGDDESEVLGESGEVAGPVRDSGSAGPAAVQQHERRAGLTTGGGAGGGCVDVARSDANGPLGQPGDGGSRRGSVGGHEASM